jgi:sugar-specific transcriptional regulator TrmB
MLKPLKNFIVRKPKSEIEYIREEIHRSARFGYNFGIIIIEIKNSSSGNLVKKSSVHKEQFAGLKNYIRPYDRIIQEKYNRYCVILPQTDGTGCSIVKERIYDFCVKYNIKRISVGMAIYPHDSTNANKLLQIGHERLENINKKNAELYS